MSDSSIFRALVPHSPRVDSEGGWCEVWFAAMTSGDSFVMLSAREPTSPSSMHFFTAEAARTLGRQLIDAADKLEAGTITITFTGSNHSSP